MRPEDLHHLAASGCSVCQEIARRELELSIAASGRAVCGANLSADTWDLVKSVSEWIAANAERESIFLAPNPQWTVNAHLLLDHISSVTGISSEQIGKWVEATST